VGFRSGEVKLPSFAPKAIPTIGNRTEYSTCNNNLHCCGRIIARPKQDGALSFIKSLKSMSSALT
jgi:hypothetical protein